MSATKYSRSPERAFLLDYNRVLASYRIVVENIIRCLKVFRILSSVYRRRRFGLRFNLIAGIYNRDLQLKADL